MATAVEIEKHSHGLGFCHAVLSSRTQSHCSNIQQHNLVVMGDSNTAVMKIAVTDAQAIDTVNDCQKLIVQGPANG